MTCTPKHRKCPSCGACVDHLCRVPVSTETRPCAEIGCKVPVTRPSGTGRWPDRCPEHRAQHIAAESARRVAASRARRRSS